VARRGAQRAFEQIPAAAIACGGTVTGEHGIALSKRAGMRAELEPGALAMQAAVKQALDPLNLFNPGKVEGDPAADTSLSWAG
jgi:glycolate oxidase